MFRIRRIRSELPRMEPGVFIIEMSEVLPKPKFLAGVLQLDDPDEIEAEFGTAGNTLSSSTDDSSEKVRAIQTSRRDYSRQA